MDVATGSAVAAAGSVNAQMIIATLNRIPGNNASNINNLATAQSSKEAPNLVDVKRSWQIQGVSLHWQKGRLQRRAKKTESFWAGMITESEMTLEW